MHPRALTVLATAAALVATARAFLPCQSACLVSVLGNRQHRCTFMDSSYRVRMISTREKSTRINNNSDLNGKVAVVTGASRGIGKGIALALGQRGCTVYVTGRSAGGKTTAKVRARFLYTQNVLQFIIRKIVLTV